MIALLRFFLRLARLQQGPQDLPASTSLLALMVLANLLVGAVGGSDYFGSLQAALLANLVDAGVVAGMVWLLLSVNNRRMRFVQTVTAMFGLGALYSLAMLLAQGLSLGGGADQLAGLLMLVILVWAQVAMGHVLRHALEQSLFVGVALAMGISTVSFVVVGNLFPPPVPVAG